MKGKLIKTGNNYLLRDFKGETLAISGGNIKGRMLSLKNCQAIERGHDLDELAEKHYDVQIKRGHTEEDSLQRKIDFILGVVSALEIIGDKKFSEEQMRRAYLLGRGDESIVKDLGASNKEKMQYSEDLKKGFENFLSLQQTEWDVEIVQEQGKDTFGNAELTWYNPKIDKDGCLILKRIDDE